MSVTEFFISKMEQLDDVTQVLIAVRRANGEVSYDTYGQVAADTLGLLEFVRVCANYHINRELDGEDE